MLFSANLTTGSIERQVLGDSNTANNIADDALYRLVTIDLRMFTREQHGIPKLSSEARIGIRKITAGKMC